MGQFVGGKRGGLRRFPHDLTPYEYLLERSMKKPSGRDTSGTTVLLAGNMVRHSTGNIDMDHHTVLSWSCPTRC